MFTRVITNITDGCEIGYKYFDFGADGTGGGMTAALRVRGGGVNCRVRILADEEEIGVCEIGTGDGVYRARTKPVVGRHAVRFLAEHRVPGWMGQFFEGRTLFELEEFVFLK